MPCCWPPCCGCCCWPPCCGCCHAARFHGGMPPPNHWGGGFCACCWRRRASACCCWSSCGRSRRRVLLLLLLEEEGIRLLLLEHLRRGRCRLLRCSIRYLLLKKLRGCDLRRSSCRLCHCRCRNAFSWRSSWCFCGLLAGRSNGGCLGLISTWSSCHGMTFLLLLGIKKQCHLWWTNNNASGPLLSFSFTSQDSTNFFYDLTPKIVSAVTLRASVFLGVSCTPLCKWQR